MLPVIFLLQILTPNSVRQLEWGNATEEFLCLTPHTFHKFASFFCLVFWITVTCQLIWDAMCDKGFPEALYKSLGTIWGILYYGLLRLSVFNDEVVGSRVFEVVRADALKGICWINSCVARGANGWLGAILLQSSYLVRTSIFYLLCLARRLMFHPWHSLLWLLGEGRGVQRGLPAAGKVG